VALFGRRNARSAARADRGHRVMRGGPRRAARRAAARRAFNALQGAGGEDGCVQGCWNGCASPIRIRACWPRRWPWTSSGPKRSSRRRGCLWWQASSRRARRCWSGTSLRRLCGQAQQRGVVGRGLHRARGVERPRLAETMPAEVMVEAYAAGRRLTTAVLGDRALTVTTSSRTAGRLRRQVRARRLAPCGAGRSAARGVRRLPGLCAAVAPGAGLPGPVAHRLPLGRAPGPRWPRDPRAQHPARHDAHLARARAGAGGGHLLPGPCRHWWRTPRADAEAPVAAHPSLAPAQPAEAGPGRRRTPRPRSGPTATSG
jgi:hypothetical protein